MATPNATKQDILDAYLGSATVRVLLLDNSASYTFDKDNHDFVSDITSAGTEMSGTGYSRKTLSNVTITVDDTDDEGVVDADDVTWTGLDAGTIQTIVVYKQVGTDDSTPSDDPIVDVLDDATVSDLPLTTNGSDVTISWDAEGILNLA